MCENIGDPLHVMIYRLSVLKPYLLLKQVSPSHCCYDEALNVAGGFRKP